MKTTRHFEESALRDRPYIQREWCERVIANQVKVVTQSDGRIQFWGFIAEFGGRALRVVTLEDGETVRVPFQIEASKHLNEE